MTLNEPVHLQGRSASLTFRKVAREVVVLEITGSDGGEHGKAPFACLERALADGPFSLFVDARDTKGASLDVSNSWAQWLARNRHRLGRVHMLTGSRFVKLTADFVRRFAGLGDMMVLYDDPSVFEETLEAATHVA
ncbi:MAG: hypothetical protein U0174_08545 [Polyangiaceae bacterium]